MKRLKYGATKDMSPEEYKEYKRNLQRSWRKRNKEWVKEHNHDWWIYYKENKPRICICKYCGNEFNAPRNYYKICPDCKNKPKKCELIKMAREQRKKTRQEMIEEARDWYKAGMTQEAIALDFGVSQKCISNWVKGVKDV
jgi:predicted transcriptional regulator